MIIAVYRLFDVVLFQMIFLEHIYNVLHHCGVPSVTPKQLTSHMLFYSVQIIYANIPHIILSLNLFGLTCKRISLNSSLGSFTNKLNQTKSATFRFSNVFFVYTWYFFKETLLTRISFTIRNL